MAKSQVYLFKGLNRDLSNINASEQYAYDIRNMRITVDETNSLMSLTTSRGTEFTGIKLNGVPIGLAVIDDELIIFCAAKKNLGNLIENIEYSDKEIDNFESESIDVASVDIYLYDYIYKIKKIGTEYSCSYVKGKLNFKETAPIEALTFYENDSLKKVYWTDGINYPRFIITEEIDDREIKPEDINFLPELKEQKEVITISKLDTSDALFPAGVMLYCFSYINYYGLLSNLFYISSLYYNAAKDRGLSTEENSVNSYKIELKDLSSDYNYVRIYSILRTSVDTIPQVKVIKDCKIDNGSVTYIDRNIEGYSIDPSELFYIGGEYLIVLTLTQKDNTLFLGNIKQVKEVLDLNIIDSFKENNSQIKLDFIYDTDKVITEDALGEYYKHTSLLSQQSSKITTFKYRDYYRFGIQLLHKSGKWSEPIFIKDLLNTLYPKSILDFIYDIEPGDIPLIMYAYLHKHTLISAKLQVTDLDLISNIKQLGYIKARPVIVYPEFHDREVICQGYISPTVYKADFRRDNLPYVQSSWFARPWFKDKYYSQWDNGDEYNNGAVLEFRHNAYIGGRYTAHQELQSSDRDGGGEGAMQALTTFDPNTWFGQHSHQFFVDSSIVTMHSPEIEFEDYLKTVDFSQYKFRIIGYVPLSAYLGDIDITTNSVTPLEWETNYDLIKGDTGYDYVGFYKKSYRKSNYGVYGNRVLCSDVFYRTGFNFGNRDKYKLPRFSDVLFINFIRYDEHEIVRGKTSIMGYHCHPFQCGGSIRADEDNESNKLQYKKISNIRYSYGSSIISDLFGNNTSYKEFDISSINIFSSTEDLILPIKNYNNDTIYYKGNLDYVYTGSSMDGNGDIQPGCRIFTSALLGWNLTGITNKFKTLNTQLALSIKPDHSWGKLNTNPIKMRYKSTPHLVISLKGDKNKQVTIPVVGNNEPEKIEDYIANGHKLFWELNKELGEIIKDYEYDIIDNDKFNCSGLWLAEVYRDVNSDIIFGGQTSDVIANNNWVIAGDSVDIGINIQLKYTEGDTYYQRYDNLKTYPYSMEEENAITDVISYMVETRINLDGRYDLNRPEKPHFHIFPDNFNVINKAYSQRNNFFTFHGVDLDKINIHHFPNLVTWSKTKTSGELVDTWLNHNLASTLELDGSKGKINSLLNYNGNLLAFLDSAILSILYNEQTLISTENGVPIELSNSNKVSGSRAITNNAGCINKWSIQQTPNGLYFIDSLNKDFYRLGENLQNISSELGLNTYFKNNSNIIDIWNPTNRKAFKLNYDPLNKEILIGNGEESLVFSELTGTFTSFFDFNVPYLCSFKNNHIALLNNKVYEYLKGEHNNFFDVILDNSIEFISNPNPLNDKIFNTVEFRSDSYYNEELLNETFNSIQVFNEYQDTGEVGLLYKENGVSNLKKKFRIWRANIPRDLSIKGKLNKIRNTWTRIKLKRNNKHKNLKTILHDITVHYSI